MSMLDKISPTAASVTSGSFKAALPGSAGGVGGYVASRMLFPKRGGGYKSRAVGVVAGVTAGEVISGKSSAISGLLGIAGASFLPKYIGKLGRPLRGDFMTSIGLPLVGYAVGKYVSSMLGK